MEELAYYFRLVLALLFMTTAWSKFQRMGEHIGILEDYRIVPKSWVPLVARVETNLEGGLGVLLLVGVWYKWAALVGCGLLVVYTIAITVNLIRGRREISCGCGGAAGNHQLSWWLVSRNAALIGGGFTVHVISTSLGSLDAVFAGESWEQVWNGRSLVVAVMAALTIAMWSTVNLMHGMQKDMLALWERKS